MCYLTQVSRASYYRHLEEAVPDEAEMAMRVAVQEVVLAHRRRYGYRRVTMELHRRGLRVNHKRVLRLMREDNLLAIRYRKYVLTTDSQHDCQVYVNLAARLTVTAVNQLWVADITYIRLRVEFVFLAVVIDRFSRKAIGWSLDRTLAARVAVTALRQAIARRQPPPGVVHHSDQGVQCQPRLCRCARGAPSPNQEPESPPRHDGVSYFHVYEFDVQRSSEHALLSLYMSLKIAMRDSWKSLPIAARMH